MAKFINPFTDVLNRMPWLAQEAVFQRLASIADVASLSKQERQAYDEDLRKYRDTVAVMEGQYLEGRAEGRAEGIEEGIMKVARNMKESGAGLADIVKFTGLNEEQIKLL